DVSLFTPTLHDALPITPDGRQIALACARDARRSGQPGEVRICDLRSGKHTVLREGIQGDVLAVAFLPGGKHLVSGGGVGDGRAGDRKSTRLNSSHVKIS